MIVKLQEDILQGSFLKNREVEMRLLRGCYMGIEWKPLLFDSNEEKETDTPKLNIHSLSISPEELHQVFFEKAEHLTEAIDNQNLVIDISGIKPEKLKKNIKMISIESITQEFNGELYENMLHLPFKGVSENNINIEYSEIDSNWAIKLSVIPSEINQNQIIRTFLLPKLANEPTGEWSSKNLTIKF